jgi:hypothetical protein
MSVIFSNFTKSQAKRQSRNFGKDLQKAILSAQTVFYVLFALRLEHLRQLGRGNCRNICLIFWLHFSSTDWKSPSFLNYLIFFSLVIERYCLHFAHLAQTPAIFDHYGFSKCNKQSYLIRNWHQTHLSPHA